MSNKYCLSKLNGIIFSLYIYNTYNDLYPESCQSYKKVFSHWNQRLSLWKLLFDETFETFEDLLLLENNLIEKIPDPGSAKEHY